MDQAWGIVERTIDGDTLCIRITSVRRSNAYPYGAVERVRLRSINAPEMGTRAGQAARRWLAHRWSKRRVRLDIYARDVYGRLLAEILSAT